MRRRGSLEAPEEVLLDASVRGADRAFYEIGNWSVSSNGRLLAWAEDRVGRRQYTLRFRDLQRGEDLADEIPGCSGSMAWAADQRTVLYVVNHPDTLRSGRCRHRPPPIQSQACSRHGAARGWAGRSCCAGCSAWIWSTARTVVAISSSLRRSSMERPS